jgi:hypothetical protein
MISLGICAKMICQGICVQAKDAVTSKDAVTWLETCAEAVAGSSSKVRAGVFGFTL